MKVVKDIIISIDLINTRINKIKQATKDFNNGDVPEIYYLDCLKLNLIEIGEESKIINDFLLDKEGSWDDILSKSYNFRISLTHYYKEMKKEIILNYIDRKFGVFCDKILELENKYKKSNQIN